MYIEREMYSFYRERDVLQYYGCTSYIYIYIYIYIYACSSRLLPGPTADRREPEPESLPPPSFITPSSFIEGGGT